MVAKRTTSRENPRPEHWNKGLPEKQAAVFQFIRMSARKNEMAPKKADIREAFPELSSSSLSYILRSLEQADYIRRIESDSYTSFSPTGPRALDEAEIWKLVDEGFASWSGGKPKGASSPIELTPGQPMSEWIIENRR